MYNFADFTILGANNPAAHPGIHSARDGFDHRETTNGFENMMKRIARICAPLALALIALSAEAESLVDGDLEAGKAKSTTCAACHGAEGISMTPLWPNLAGQNAKYVAEQLKNFKEGRRVNALMSSQAMMLSDEDMRDLAVYYESLPMPAQAVADPELLPRGVALYRGGNADAGVPACIACHGPTGRGNPGAAYPALNGQHAAYAAKTLVDYASGERTAAGPVQIMQGISDRLTQKDIQALASYLQGLK